MFSTPATIFRRFYLSLLAWRLPRGPHGASAERKRRQKRRKSAAKAPTRGPTVAIPRPVEMSAGVTGEQLHKAEEEEEEKEEEEKEEEEEEEEKRK